MAKMTQLFRIILGIILTPVIIVVCAAISIIACIFSALILSAKTIEKIIFQN